MAWRVSPRAKRVRIMRTSSSVNLLDFRAGVVLIAVPLLVMLSNRWTGLGPGHYCSAHVVPSRVLVPSQVWRLPRQIVKVTGSGRLGRGRNRGQVRVRE